MAQTMVDCVCVQCKNHFQVTLGAFNRGKVKFCSNECKYRNIKEKAEDRFWSQVDKFSHSGGCWIWLGIRNKQGYGRFFAGGWQGAHRYAWKLKNGPIPDHLLACHKCDNPPCCNPDHIFIGTHLDNFADMKAKGRSAKGEKNCSHKYPELNRGENNPRSKLTIEQVQKIRAAYPGDGRTRKIGARTNKAVGATLKSLAKQYNVSFSVIHAIVTNRIWTDVK